MTGSLVERSRLVTQRGMTMIEVMVAVAVLTMIAVLIHGVINSLSRGKKGEAMRSDRAHQGRESMQRLVRDLSGAYLSLHAPTTQALITQKTAFVGRSSSPFDRLDFTAFAHLRTERESHESDQAEVGYFVVADPDVADKMDLVRREQTPIDLEPLKGGVVSVVAEDVDEFDVRFLDAQSGQWVETWDSTQVAGQPNRLPLEVEITLELKGVGGSLPYRYTTKVFLPIQRPLSFGIQQQ
ncbi:MAG: prepilin-type N-terminal cleavage/methylation domain-containing protein [Myxococcota bacterium]|nr:prepilin-type N-terminal cleavage/methylation domain-containing protein [Myxococcota bacterium]